MSMVVIENKENAKMLVGSVFRHVCILVFLMFDSRKENFLDRLTYKLVFLG